ncbi:MAG: caspase family protein [SAR324 cluster bacterium]|nr:caspase family protein [SAR324 cluster bacterium]
MHSRVLLLFILIILLPYLSSAQQQNSTDSGDDFSVQVYRQALVIENTGYQDTKDSSPSLTPTNQVNSALESLGFQVTTLGNAKQRETEKAIRQFGRSLRDNGGVGVFYYTGHMVQFENENYLLPIDTKLTRIADVRYKTVPLGKLLGQMKFAGNQINIIILDACSPNPFIEGLQGVTPGMMETKAPENMLISYACTPNTLAEKTDPERLFTSVLLQRIKTVRTGLNEIFEQTSADITQKSDGQHTPWFSSSVTKEFFFAPNENFLEEHAPKPVVVKNEDTNELEVEKSDNQTVAAKKSDNQTSQNAEIFIEELATPPDDQRIFRFKRTYVNQQLANLNALLNDARVIPIEQDGKPWFIFDFVREGSIYEKLGLKNKDVIVQINGFTVDSLPKALKLFEALQLEEKITLRIKREGQLTDFQYFIDS